MKKYIFNLKLVEKALNCFGENDGEIRFVNVSLGVTVSHSQTYFKKPFFFSLNLSNHFYSEQVCSGIDVLLTPVQHHGDAPNIKLSRDIPDGVELNYILLKWYYDQKMVSFFSSDFESVFAKHPTGKILNFVFYPKAVYFECKIWILRSAITHVQN